jgi:hypothetical protein
MMRRILQFQLVFAVAMLFWGVFIIPAQPYLVLDVVLTPAELADHERHDDALRLLSYGDRVEQIAWLVAALAIAVMSIAGLNHTRPKSDDAESPATD